MKSSALFFCLITFSFFLYGNAPRFLIEAEGDSVSVSMGQQKPQDTQALKKRISQLERQVHFLEGAVRELQKTVFANYYAPKPASSPSTIQVKAKKTVWSCYLQDPFGNTFDGKGSTEMEAAGLALKACGGGLHCKKEKLKCSSETQTQEKIISPAGGFSIETKNKRTWSCMLQDSFNRTFTGKGETEAEARVKALKACGGGMHCKDKNISCSHN